MKLFDQPRLLALRTAAPSLTRDLAGIVGALSLSYGAGLAYRPAGFMVLGVLLLTVAILTARSGPK